MLKVNYNVAVEVFKLPLVLTYNHLKQTESNKKVINVLTSTHSMYTTQFGLCCFNNCVELPQTPLD